jgi:hypothetical protein
MTFALPRSGVLREPSTRCALRWIGAVLIETLYWIAFFEAIYWLTPPAKPACYALVLFC